MVRCVDGIGSLLCMVPDSELIACHVIRGAYASQRRDSTGASVIEMCVPQ